MNTQEIKITNAQTISINAKMQDKVVTPSLEQQTILPDENYNSLSKVVVNAVTLENKIVHPNRDTQIITPTESLGLSSVTVEPVSLEEKSIVPKKEVQVLNPSNEYVGFSQVTVEKIPEDYIIPEGNKNIVSNGDYDVKDNATVNVNVQPNLQEKEARVTAPTNIFIHPDEEYDGLSFVNVIANVDTETKEVTPTKEVQTINRSDGKYIDSVTVNAIPEDYIIPSGELEITENGSYDVTDKASVNVEIQPNVETKTITSNGVYNASDDGLDGYSSVEVATSGADLTEYFAETIKGGTSTKPGFVETIKKIPPLKNEGSTCVYMFHNFLGEEIDLKNFDTSNVSNMQYMFSGCSNLKELDLSNFNTSNVLQMQYMFSGCSNLKELDLSNFNTSNVLQMDYIFSGCSNLKSLDLTNFNTSKSQKISYMFYNCRNLERIIGIENFDTSSVTSATNIFYGCNKLTSLNLDNWTLSNVTSISNMFNYCNALMYLDIRNIDFTNKTGNYVFAGIPADCEIIVKDDTAKTWVLTQRSDLTNVKTVAELGE